MRKKKIKAEIDDQGRVYFWKNDKDGLSQQDFIIVLMSIALFGGIIIGLLVTIIGMFFGFDLPETYINLIRVLDIPFATVIAGIFTVKTASTIVNKESKQEPEKEYLNESQGDDYV